MVVDFKLVYVLDSTLLKSEGWRDIELIEESDLLVQELVGARLFCLDYADEVIFHYHSQLHVCLALRDLDLLDSEADQVLDVLRDARFDHHFLGKVECQSHYRSQLCYQVDDRFKCKVLQAWLTLISATASPTGLPGSALFLHFLLAQLCHDLGVCDDFQEWLIVK